jgi:2-polyprenyl-3-methyl-5-hydroxy-6-metoxy-1,4-benzoquinol methylase
MKLVDCLDVYEDAEFYDQEFASRGHDIPFYVNLARLAGGPVLEVACGTGRLTLPIAREGIQIIGSDISRPMLERARSKANSQGLDVEWLEQDCRKISSKQRFALIFSATNAMQHLHDLDSINAFLTSAKKALRPGGVLILDVFNPNPAKLARATATRYHHKTFTDAAGVEVRVDITTQYDTASQILSFTLFYLCSGNLKRTKNVKMRCLFPEELMTICHFNGLDVTKRYGDYDETPFKSDSPKQILLCRDASDAKCPA